jgi:hypothetical protein
LKQKVRRQIAGTAPWILQRCPQLQIRPSHNRRARLATPPRIPTLQFSCILANGASFCLHLIFDLLMFAFSPKRKAATVEKRDPSRARVAAVAASNRTSKRAREADAATGLRSQRNLRYKK